MSDTASTPTAAPTLPAVTGDNIADYVGKYIKLRDKIKEIEEGHKEQLAPYKNMLETLNNMLLGHLHSVGGDNLNIKGVGTFYKTTRVSASIADGDAFRRHVIGTEAWELLDWKANATAVKQFIEDNNCPPPGVNMSSVVTAGVRRAG